VTSLAKVLTSVVALSLLLSVAAPAPALSTMHSVEYVGDVGLSSECTVSAVTAQSTGGGCLDALREAYRECTRDEEDSNCFWAVMAAIGECQDLFCSGICVVRYWGEWLDMIQCVIECYLPN